MIREEILDIKPYVPGKPIEEVKRELGIDDVIKLASNENPLGPSKQAIEAMEEAASKIHIYPHGSCHTLKKILSKRLGVKKEEIIFGNGSDDILKFIGESFVKADEEVIIARPSFSEYEFATNLMGGNVVTVPLTNYKHDLDAMLKAITDRTKLVFICNPNNPTGTIVTQQEVDAFMAEVPEDVIVVFDEAYQEYVTSDDYPETIDYLVDYDNVIILRTFSKVYGLAGLRIGYAISNEELIGYLNRVRPPFEVNSMAQVAAEATLQDQNHLDRSREVNFKGKEYLYQEFERLGLEYVPTEANFILVDVKKDANKVFADMQQRGVIIRNAQAFGYETMIRVTIGTREQNQRLIDTLEKVLD
ncbi:histidinol-phosphate transaminase [Sporohalobacter salinus]|uniref:histidinol-phosphate transaminase n=1 Tax=Sporohalobacter salinus TaxID=1494606 RepID=UPI001960F499|nr:histidinol-phosphate transaminase [Sporohalobacter salinus]MBM7623832.1 histidinol-phosphate aminotransferase [Sporohalobacter salinus]